MDTPSWFVKDISLGAVGHEVETVQLLLRLPKTGRLDEDTLRAIRGWQRLHGLQATGMVDAVTAGTLGELHWVPDPGASSERYTGSGTDWVRWDGSSAARNFNQLRGSLGDSGNELE